MTWPPGRARTKYGNKKTVLDGRTFDSKREARRWAELLWQAKAGEIRELRRQVPFELAPPTRIEGEKRMKPAIRYVADFVYEDITSGRLIVEDVKSAATARTPEFRMKLHLMKTIHGIDVRLTT